MRTAICYLTMAEKDCVLTSSDADVEDLSAFVTERLQCSSEGSVEKLIGEGGVDVEEILRRSVGIGGDGGDKRQSVCPHVTIGGMLMLIIEGCPRTWRVIGFCGRNWVGRTSLQLQRGLHGPFTLRNAAVCRPSRKDCFARRVCLMWLVGVELLEALNCREKMLLTEVKVFLKVS